MLRISKPEVGEYAPYTIDYIKLVPEDGEVLAHLAQNSVTMCDYVRALPADTLTTPHAEGEWTVQDILVHIIDTERVFAYRALRIARGDTTDLPGFEQGDYAVSAHANQRTLDSILDEYVAVRQASLTLFHSLDEVMLTRQTRASGNMTSVRALIYQTAGHELHHLYSMREHYGE
jgi:uncharacterized damage-inducible protein DinB